jgi:hypothetical protein
MKLRLALFAICLSTSAFATVPRLTAELAPSVVQEVQYSRQQNQEIRRCMRRIYGRNYFRGVRAQHRMAMLRACGV